MNKYVLRPFYGTLIQLLFYSVLFADVGVLQSDISGRVTDEAGNPISSVSVLVKGGALGTATDESGRYRLNAPDASTLIFSYVGYISQEVNVAGRTTIDVILAEDVSELSEVVVVGYGTQEVKDVTGSVTSVQTESLENMPTTSFEQALKGRASGVQISQNSGTPGGRTEVRIRGGNSMIGSNNPLFVVDGFPITGGIDHLNPSDIASIDILKDASATAIYGARGANGVVIVTTKRGSTNQRSQVDIHTFYGIQNQILRVDVLNAEQYAIVANEFLKNEGQPPFFEIDRTAGTVTDGLGNVSTLEGTNWQDVGIRSAPTQRHSIGVSGGGERTSYNLSFNYLDQVGIVHNSGLKRGNLRLNLDNSINDRLKLAASLNFNRDQIDAVEVDNRANHEILGMAPPPTLPVRDEAGVPTRLQTIYFFASEDMEHPDYIGSPYKDRTIQNSILANVSLDYEITDGLVFRSLVGLEYITRSRDYFIPKIYPEDRGTALQGSVFSNSVLNENTLSYSKLFDNKHKIDAVGGVTFQSFRDRTLSVNAIDLANNVTENHNLGSAGIVNPPVDGITEWVLLSGLGRVNYSYMSKYMFTVSLRADGSSRFGDNNKWGYFPSAAIAWRISEEPFMRDVAFISDLKLRASYGVTGNTALSPYQSLSRLGNFRAVYGSNTDFIGFAPSNIENPTLRWETTVQRDAGFDLSLFGGMVDFSFDYYQKVTDNLLASVPLPTSSGFESVLRNVGKVQNQGIELAAYADLIDKAFKWDVSGQYSYNRNEVVSLAGGSDILGAGLGNPFGAAGINIAREGEPFGAFYGYREDGIIPETGQRNIVDINGDGSITADDRVVLGSPHPDFFFGLTNNFSYKNFSLNVFLEGVVGNDVYWAAGAIHTNSYQRGHNQIADFFGNYWTEENPNNAKYPKVSSETFVQASDKLLFDASYLRLKNITLAYDFQNISWLNRAQIYVSAMNLFTVTDYPGGDPEVNSFGSDSADVGERLRMGVASTVYPSARTFIIGAKINL